MSPAADDRVALRWAAREPPLAPVALAAQGPAAWRLAERLIALDDAVLGALSGVASPGALLVAGPSEALPWVDGGQYLGVLPDAPGLLLPTTLAPGVPAPLLARALGDDGAPWAVLPTGTALSAAAARPVSRARLVAWLASQPGRAA